MSRILHAGCGNEPLPSGMDAGCEVRLDVDPETKPDVVASITDLGEIGEFEAVYCCHTLEHLALFEIRKALKEFHRVLLPGGIAVIRVPDLEEIRPTPEIVYTSAVGPISGLDMYYGHQKLIESSPFMAHKYGFTRERLLEVLVEAGFAQAKVERMTPLFELWGVATK